VNSCNNNITRKNLVFLIDFLPSANQAPGKKQFVPRSRERPVWKPFSRGGAPLHLSGPAVLELGGERAALLICYEQVIPWTVLTAALAHPTLFVGMSNVLAPV
jgi:hypothetical protein